MRSPFFTFALLAAAFCYSGASDAKPIWQDLLVSDCSGGVHVLPGTPAGISHNTYQDIQLLDVIKKALMEVTQCAEADEATKSCDIDDLMKRFIPSLHMINANMFGFDDAPDPRASSGTKGAVYSFFSPGMPIFKLLPDKFESLILGLIPASTSVSVKELFKNAGITCSPSEFAKGNPCRIKLNLMSAIGINVGIHWQKCAKDSTNVYFSANCLGDMCNTYLRPCTPSSNSCGKGGHCKSVSLTAEDIKRALVTMGLMKDDSKESALAVDSAVADFDQCINDASEKKIPFAWRVVSRLRKWADGYFGTKSTPAASFGYCLPDIMKDGFEEVGENFRNIFEKFNAEERDLWNTSSKFMSCLQTTCSVSDVGNDVCNNECDNEHCFFDGGDCAGPDEWKIQSSNISSATGYIPYGVRRNDDYGGYDGDDLVSPSRAENMMEDVEFSTYDTSKNVNATTNYGVCVRKFMDFTYDQDIDWDKHMPLSLRGEGMPSWYFEYESPDSKCESFGSAGQCKPEYCVWIPVNMTNCRAISSTNGGPDVFTSLQFPDYRYENLAMSSQTPTCGDGVCNRVRVWKCVPPLCDPRVEMSNTEDVEKMKWTPYWESEEDSCPSDCGTGASSCFSPYATRDDSDDNYTVTVTDGGLVTLGQRDEFFEHSSAMRYTEYHIVMNTGVKADEVLSQWDGKFNDGSSSSDLMWGLKKQSGVEKGYSSPGPDFFDAGYSGMALFRHDCDGTIGFNLGNGLGGSVKFRGLPSIVHTFGTLVEEIQSCRNAFNKVSELSAQAFRDRWQIWTADPVFKYYMGQNKLDSLDPNMPQNGVLSSILNTLNPKKQEADARNQDYSFQRVVIDAPDTCSYSSWRKDGLCRIKFTSLADLLNFKNEASPPEENVYFTMYRCPAPNNKALPAFSITLDGSQLTFTNPIKFCDGNCKGMKNLKCFNPENVLNINEAFRDRQLEITPKNFVEPVKSNAYAYPRTSDPLSLMIYGPRMGTRCSPRPRNVQKFIRDVVRGSAFAATDGSSSLSFCAPAMTEVISSRETSKLQEAALRFIPEAFCRGGPDDCFQEEPCTPWKKPELCNRYETKPLLEVTGGEVQTAKVRGLEATRENALAYQQLSKIVGEIIETEADPGHAWSATTVSLSESFYTSACSTIGKDGIRREVMRKLKADSKLWNDLRFRHVQVSCPNLVPPSSRRLTVASRRSLSSSDLIIWVQIPKDIEAKAMISTVKVCESKSKLVEIFNDAGIRDSANRALRATAISSVETSDELVTTMTESVHEASATKLRRIETYNAVVSIDINNDKDKEENQETLSVAAIIWIAVGALVFVGIITFLIMKMWSPSSTNNSRQAPNTRKKRDTVNPVGGFELSTAPQMSNAVLAQAVAVQALQATPPPPPPAPSSEPVPVGYHDGKPYYLDANGNTTWTPPKL